MGEGVLTEPWRCRGCDMLLSYKLTDKLCVRCWTRFTRWAPQTRWVPLRTVGPYVLWTPENEVRFDMWLEAGSP